MSDLEVFFPDGTTGDLARLQREYGSKIQVCRSVLPAAFRLRKINIDNSGNTLIRIWVFDKRGMPAVGQPVTYSYPQLGGGYSGLPLITGVKDAWTTRGVQNKNRCDGMGRVEFQIGSDSWIKDGAGPYIGYVLSPTIGSDCLAYFGWLGGTNHVGPCELFFYEEDGSTPPPVDPPPVDPGDGDDEPGPVDSPDVLAAINETNRLLGLQLAELRSLAAHLGA